MQDKVAIITGASSGIGKSTACKLANEGATIAMVCRNKRKAAAARTEIIERTGNKNIDVFIADLALLQNVEKIADQIRNKYPAIDVLINNAGIMPADRKFTEEGHEHSWAVNHLAPFLLTNLLLDNLKAAGRSRIINVSSEAHRLGQIDFYDMHASRRYSNFTAYCDSKLANVLFTYELTRRLENTEVTANCLHPGLVASNFGTKSSGIYKLVWNLTKPFMISPEEGAETSAFLASSPSVAGISGCYFKNKVAVKSSSDSYNPVLAKRLWDMSAEQVKTASCHI
ncbi:MAG: SDR family oxidoreductase [Hymenobacteraceae bacterium]|nr:SDR family oxidoreductase [Hymenobacteraceae bacterium]MDX5395437.1 SDR family oxidoreductase [Hymenobacteraceae bacterium]MDX5511486.1 SDR family oxidoreductase [Hymenobacteraceae bacterium]